MLALRAILLTALTMVACFATAGLAEWEIKTPGGNLISHVDPFIAANGTCLRSARPEMIYVAHLEWWRYYRNAVVGKAKKGFFILDEISHAVSFLVSEAGLNGAIAERQLGTPTAPQMTPDDGWRQVWGPALTRQLQAADDRWPSISRSGRGHQSGNEICLPANQQRRGEPAIAGAAADCGCFTEVPFECPENAGLAATSLVRVIRPVDVTARPEWLRESSESWMTARSASRAHKATARMAS